MQNKTQTVESPALRRMLRELTQALGDRLVSVVLYGSAARGDFHEKTSDFNLLIVVRALDPPTLEALSDPVLHWERGGQPTPSYFTRELIADAADVFPIEFLDIQRSRVVLHGEDPFRDMKVHDDHLRLQCEKELREKLMRLREGYIEAQRKPRELNRLLTDSYTTFVALFRGCLHLLGGEIPVHNAQVVAAFCKRTGQQPGPFDEVERLKRGERATSDLKAVFAAYYTELTRAVEAIDRFRTDQGGRTS